MKKHILLLISSILIFTSCSELGIGTGTIKYEINTDSNSYYVEYINEHDNKIIELVTDNNNWSEEFEFGNGQLASLKFGNGSEFGNGDPVFVELIISFNGNSLISYTGETDYHYMNCHTE